MTVAAAETGRIERMESTSYDAIVALSQSGMKDLLESPLHYWQRHINPRRKEKESTPEMIFGSALHTLILEGIDVFESRYAKCLCEEDFPGCLITIEDLRIWLKDQGCQPRGTRKAELIEQVRAKDPSQPIWDVLKVANQSEHEGKTFLSVEDWNRCWAAAEAFRSEPAFAELIEQGQPEVALVGNHWDTGTPLKGRADWIGEGFLLDLKTFRQKRGCSIDQSIADAIWFEAYYRQAYLYAKLHQQITGAARPTRFVMAFVESDEPYEVRLREFRPSTSGYSNLYWTRAELEVRGCCETWDLCREQFGESPWLTKQRIEVLRDEDIRQLAY